jgi:predicted PurR-regulated permease PerM
MARRPWIRGRVRQHRPADRQADELVVELRPGDLSGIFAAPAWLRDMGVMAWLLVGVIALLAGTVALLSLIDTIVVPVITATILAAVLSPVVAYLARRMPRAAATAVVFVALLVAGGAIGVLVLAGIVGEAEGLEGGLQQGVTKIQGWLQDLGVGASTANDAADSASSGVSNAFDTLIHGLGSVIGGLTSLAVFLSFTALSLFFLLKDGPQIREWTERHMGIPQPVASTITRRTIGALRAYFAGVTAVAVFNAVVIGLGALVLGVPHLGSIMLVNFVAAYIPYLGAWTAGAFTVLLALGEQGTTAAIAMAVVVLLANGALQQMIQPIAFGATLGIHPLAVLIVTIAGGALFGTIGLVLAAPLTSAALHVSADLARARASEERRAAEPEAPPPVETTPGAAPEGNPV